MAFNNKFKQVAAWFLTKKGKNAVYYAAGAASTGVLLVSTLPHTIFIEQYKEFIHLYKKGFTVPLSKTLKERFLKALTLCEIEKVDQHLFKPFACYGFDIFSAGTSYSKYGVIIGLPANFFYSEPLDIEKNIIKIRDTSIVWDTDEGKLLEKSLILSENAQLYAMAREIKFRETPKVLLDCIISTISVAGYFGLTNFINQNLNLYVRPLFVRLVLYALTGTFCFGSYAFGKDVTQVYFENQIDKELKAKNEIFAKGGEEFYTKLIQRNIALRKLLGKDGERAYSILGNENYLFRHKHIPLIHRKSFFENNNSENYNTLLSN